MAPQKEKEARENDVGLCVSDVFVIEGDDQLGAGDFGGVRDFERAWVARIYERDQRDDSARGDSDGGFGEGAGLYGGVFRQRLGGAGFDYCGGDSVWVGAGISSFERRSLM